MVSFMFQRVCAGAGVAWLISRKIFCDAYIKSRCFELIAYQFLEQRKNQGNVSCEFGDLYKVVLRNLLDVSV